MEAKYISSVYIYTNMYIYKYTKALNTEIVRPQHPTANTNIQYVNVIRNSPLRRTPVYIVECLCVILSTATCFVSTTSHKDAPCSLKSVISTYRGFAMLHKHTYSCQTCESMRSIQIKISTCTLEYPAHATTFVLKTLFQKCLQPPMKAPLHLTEE